jgi:hypothetical protein
VLNAIGTGSLGHSVLKVVLLILRYAPEGTPDTALAWRNDGFSFFPRARVVISSYEATSFLTAIHQSPKVLENRFEMRFLHNTATTALLVAAACAEPVSRAVKAPKVDLGYTIYQGSYDVNNSINIFKG